ncbi:hypothetical protein BCR33DRAFT_364996 [Rhizoclosmatium globosum]|uniref:Cyclin N-terminal domain-containing protein n=1 Tax=Rhizoclosmatium globosum TaxID=329046 RepID=A0A1Y2C272_9FUNG|nr:hypothetical protein BCR33DRAFT_364996 [Rhizoclosmatium globosum]|eukprot:ORY40415.1 hypothetical protein BCR33DRAFT_364996 [Rhizoclosmatium globosum]
MLPKYTPISVLPSSEVTPPAQDSTPKRSAQTLEADIETDSAIPITFVETPVTHKNIVMRANHPLTPYHFSEYMGARFSDEFGNGNVESSTDEWANSSTYRTAFHLKLITRHMSLIEVDSFHNHLERLQTMEDLENQRAWTDDVLENQTEIEPIHLMISFAWIAEECYLQNWSHITYQSAVLYMYSYLVRGERFPSSDLQCLAATALMIAIKESCTISPLAYLSHFGNPDETSLKMKDFEHKFLFAVNDSRSCCPSTVVTPYEWYMAYCQLYQVWRGHRSLDQSHLLEFTWQRGLKVLDAAVMDPRSQKQTPSALAAAMFVLCENPKSNSLLHCTGYCLEQLEHAMKFIRYFEMQWFGEDGFVENQVYLQNV